MKRCLVPITILIQVVALAVGGCGREPTRDADTSNAKTAVREIQERIAEGKDWSLSGFSGFTWDNVVIFNGGWQSRDVSEALGGISGAKSKFGSSTNPKETLVVFRFGEDILAVEKLELAVRLVLPKAMLMNDEAYFVLNNKAPEKTYTLKGHQSGQKPE